VVVSGGAFDRDGERNILFCYARWESLKGKRSNK
jgi:hypothetical protein